MKIKIIAFGKNKQGFIETGVQEYLKRLSVYTKVELIILPNVKLSKSNNVELVKAKEAEKFLKNFSNNELLIVLDENGEQFSSLQFASFLKTRLDLPVDLVFLIGGVYGLSAQILEKADLKLSFSRFTFTHQMIRFILLEQIYRAFTILTGKKYHY